MEQCRKMKKYFHKEKTDFLQAKGLCFSSHIVSVLEVSSLGCSDFLGLPLPCSQETNCRHYSCRGCRKLVPPSATIDADTGFLIQTNAPKAFEQWQVIASINEGPYTVKKKRLGWTISGPLQEDTCRSTTSGLVDGQYSIATKEQGPETVR